VNTPDDLSTIAEIAIALAGFSALVGMLGSRTGRSSPKLDAFRLQIMLEASLFVVALALLPVVLLHLGVVEEIAWRASAGIFLAADAVTTVSIHVRAGNVSAEYLSADRLTSIVVQATGYAADGVVALVLVGIWSERAPGLYLLALYLNVLLSGLLFIRFAASTFVPDE